MIKAIIDYEFGTAELYTESIDPDRIVREFYACANECFSIRNAIGDVKLLQIDLMRKESLPPLLQVIRDEWTHCLRHSGGDTIVFDANHTTGSDIRYWVTLDEWGNPCQCPRHGEPAFYCRVNHDQPTQSAAMR